MNAALAQAAQTYRASQELGVSQALREEIKNGFMDMMKLLNDVLRTAESKPQPLQEGASRQVIYMKIFTKNSFYRYFP